MSSEQEPADALRRFMKVRPNTSTILGLLVLAFLAIGVTEVLTSVFGIAEMSAVGAAYLVVAALLIVFGVWLRNHHGGFAIFTGILIAIGVALFAAMYGSRPELFPTQ